jgi:demethylmenaquinone methyltransferase / 2-methoxy-6-polyprenyl-1,4-benzoquinol methylase
MNDLMSSACTASGRNAMVDWLAPRPGMRLLDVAGGTGDIAFRFLNRVRRATACHRARPDAACSTRAEARRGAAHSRARIDWVCGDAMALPFPDRSFDAYTIAFGIRNVTRPEVRWPRRSGCSGPAGG